jgi:hypothetical protein
MSTPEKFTGRALVTAALASAAAALTVLQGQQQELAGSRQVKVRSRMFHAVKQMNKILTTSTEAYRLHTTLPVKHLVPTREQLRAYGIASCNTSLDTLLVPLLHVEHSEKHIQ